MQPVAQSQALLVGRLLIGALFIVAGIRKLMGPAAAAGYFTKLGFPAADVLVWVVIAVELGGGALLVLGWQTRRMAWLLIAFTLIATFMAHRFWQMEAAQYANQLNHFLKNAALVGGLLYVVVFGAGAVSLDGARRS
jgi:putative oxidoreductase